MERERGTEREREREMERGGEMGRGREGEIEREGAIDDLDDHIRREFAMMERQEEGSAQEIGADLSELERDLTLRRLLWESQEEWETLSVDWLSCSFDSLSVENLQKHVNRFSQTIYMLEKGQ